MPFKHIFVTVGTTKFDNLIRTLCSPQITEVLLNLGCSHLKIQYGNGDEIDLSHLESKGISVEKYRLKPNILDDIKSADLVISHAGAGSCIEVLRANKPLVVVINEELMGNHQTELAEQLYKDGHLFYCTTKTLENILVNSSFKDLKPYVKGDIKEFIKKLDLLMEFS